MEKSTEKIEQTSWMQNRLFPTVGDLLAMLGIFFAVQIAVTLIGTLALLFSGRGMDDLEPFELGRFLALTSLVSLRVARKNLWRYLVQQSPHSRFVAVCGRKKHRLT